MDTGSSKRETVEVLIKPHLPVLLRLARRLMREPEDAEDLVQETCLKACRALHQFQSGSDSKAWLITILINTYRDWARKALKYPTAIAFDDMANLYRQWRSDGVPPPRQDPEAATIHADLNQRVRLAIDDLPPEFRLAVMLADVEGYAYREIAELMNCPIGTVMSRLYRGRQLLQTMLRDYVEH